MAGMTPWAVDQVLRAAKEMESRGWKYTIEGQFFENYSEIINDLGAHDFDKRKHEIKHGPKIGLTRVAEINVLPLHSPSQVQQLLALARRRSVAATMVTERAFGVYVEH